MLEVEMKFPIAAFSRLLDRLRLRGAREKASVQETDQYFNAPDRDFAVTDEALRLRQIAQANFVTYKGPKRDLQTKTRTEIEVQLAEGDEAADAFIRLLTSLGYRPVDVVRKRRDVHAIPWEGFEVEVCLDEVDGLGRFAELEILAPEDRLEPARAALLRLAAELGLGASERCSYLELLLVARGDASA